MKRILMFLALGLLTIGCCISQERQNEDEYYNPSQHEVKTGTTQSGVKLDKQKIHTSLELGTSFISFGKGRNCMYSYVSPGINYSLSPKWQLNTGLYLVKSSLLGAAGENDLFIANAGYLKSYYYMQLQNQVNEKLRITGAVIYGFDMGNNKFNKNRNVSYNDLQYSIGADLQINKNLSIGVRLTKTNENSYYNPYMSPFGNSYLMPSNGQSQFDW